MNRRFVLATIGTAFSFGLAGCLGDDIDPREEVVVEYYEFEEAADEMTFEQRKERVEELFHSDSPTSEYSEYRREGYEPPPGGISTIDTELIETDIGKERVSEARWFGDDENEDLVAAFAGENGLIDVTVESEEKGGIDWTSHSRAFVVRENGEWCIFSWGLADE